MNKLNDQELVYLHRYALLKIAKVDDEQYSVWKKLLNIVDDELIYRELK